MTDAEKRELFVLRTFRDWVERRLEVHEIHDGKPTYITLNDLEDDEWDQYQELLEATKRASST